MIKKMIFGLCLFTVVACVPQKKFQALKDDYDKLSARQKDCNKKSNELADSLTENQRKLRLETRLTQELVQDTLLLGESNRKVQKLYKQVNEAYDKLLEKVKELQNQNNLKSQELTAELIESQKKLKEREADLQKRTEEANKQNQNLQELKGKLTQLETDLNLRQKKLNEVQGVLNQKDSMVKSLKATISSALNSFQDQGLSVKVKNGKVYVSMEEKLLFESGKYTINSNGKEALLQLAKVLNDKKDVNVLVEGHTDSIPYKGSGVIKDNWDLSVLRATEVVKIIINDGKVNGNRITAAGRADSQPIAPNSTKEGRAKNRRTEIILTPKLNELFKVLEQN
ncbi:MAG: OmpA family protein [Bacteroidetes bacterium]|nr:OmpA family protein [Bacteroidota bacterium]